MAILQDTVIQGNLRVNGSNIAIPTSVTLSGVTSSGYMIYNSGTISIGSAAGAYIPLSGTTSLSGGIFPLTNATYDLGSSTSKFQSIFTLYASATDGIYTPIIQNDIGALTVGRSQQYTYIYGDYAITSTSKDIQLRAGSDIYLHAGGSINLLALSECRLFSGYVSFIYTGPSKSADAYNQSALHLATPVAVQEISGNTYFNDAGCIFIDTDDTGWPIQKPLQAHELTLTLEGYSCPFSGTCTFRLDTDNWTQRSSPLKNFYTPWGGSLARLHEALRHQGYDASYNVCPANGVFTSLSGGVYTKAQVLGIFQASASEYLDFLVCPLFTYTTDSSAFTMILSPSTEVWSTTYYATCGGC